MAAMLRPDPMPMQRMRSPTLSLSVSLAKVNGIEDGPMLPNLGKVMGTRSGGKSRPLIIAWVCTVEI